MNKESEKECEIEKGVFGLEVTTTQACNFSCSYCFERSHETETITLDANIIIKRIYELLDTEWFKNQYMGIKIILWGGEPTLNLGLCETLMTEFENDDRICFFIYSNGSTIDAFLPALIKIKDKPFKKEGVSKFTFQLSYDGNPLHDMRRVYANGAGTAWNVLHAIKKLHKSGIDYGLKATIAWKDYALMPKSWDDFEYLNSHYGSKIKYALTVDYYDVQFDQYKEEVEKALISVAGKEAKFFKKNGYFLSNIFRSRRAFCATGKSMATIDIDGSVYYCHGSIYSKCSNEFKYTNIFSKHFINSIEKANKFFYDNHIEPDECKECIATSCLRCNVKKYEESQGETFKDRWFDYPAQKQLCEYYKLVGKMSAALGLLLGSK